MARNKSCQYGKQHESCMAKQLEMFSLSSEIGQERKLGGHCQPLLGASKTGYVGISAAGLAN